MRDFEVLGEAVARCRDEPQIIAGNSDGEKTKPARLRRLGDAHTSLTVDIDHRHGARGKQLAE